VLKETINWPYLVLQLGLMSLWLALNPGMTAIAALRSWERRKKSSGAAWTVARRTHATWSIGLEASRADAEVVRNRRARSDPERAKADAPASE
jgi:hypothetical protein